MAAAEEAESLLKIQLAAADRARCLEILARASAHRGDLLNALKLLETAVRAATGNPVWTARSEAALVKRLLGWIGIEPALARLPELRKAVVRSGDGYSAIALHLLCAEIELKRYNKTGADEHLMYAAGLVERYPHLFQEASLLLLRSNQAALCSNYNLALELVHRCLQKAEEAGRGVLQAVCIHNVAYFSLVTGRLAEAAKWMQRASALSFAKDGPIGLMDLANGLDLALAVGDADLASELAHRGEELFFQLEQGNSHSGVAYLVARTRWLIRTGRHSEACRKAMDALPFAESGGDRYLHLRLRLFAAEAFARSGTLPQALRLLSDVANEGDLTLEHLGELVRVSAVLNSMHDIESGTRRFARAARILDFGGLLTASAEVARNRQEATATLGACQRADGAEVRDSIPAAIVEGWLTIADVSAFPELVGRELLAIVRATGAAQAAALLANTHDGNSSVVEAFDWIEEGEEPSRSRGDRMYIDLEGDNTRTWRLAVLPRPDAGAKLTIMEIDALLRRITRRNEGATRGPVLSALLIDRLRAEASGMIAASDSMTELLNITQRVATSNVTVLFTGETGTGKELLARALHEASPRRDKPFIPFNCSAVARDMLDSQLFGYRRGAFTGAHDAFPGVIRAAAGGTLFLDEIGEISPEVQPKLLRFLESGEIHPLGEPKPFAVDVRIVAATNANLEQLVASGRFREDLFYRLNVVRLQVPPLRERREEIPLLAQHFLDKFSRDSQKTSVRIADETLEYLILFKWPGNVRQLANEVRRMVALAESGAVLMPEHLSPEIAASRKTVPASTRDIAPTEFIVRVDQPISAAFEHLERAMVKYALEIAGDRLEDAAQMLGLSRKGLYLKRQRLKMAESSLRDDGADEAAS